MSKDFEQAYKELAQSEIPDLWDRIEAGLSEKSTPEKGKNQERKKQIYFRRYAGMAAAVLCVVLIVPAALFMGQLGQKGSTMEGAADQSAMEESMETAECAPEDAEGGELYGMPQEEADGLVESMADAGTDAVQDSAAGAAMADTAVEESRGNVLQDCEEKMERESAVESENQKAESLASQKQRELAELADGTVIEKVTVEITGETTELNDSDDINEIGVVLTAVVCKDESGLFEEGEQIEIFVPIYSSSMLIEDETFEVELIYRSNKEYPFMLRGIHY